MLGQPLALPLGHAVKPCVLRESDAVTHAVVLAPAEHAMAAEAGVGAQDDPHRGQAWRKPVHQERQNRPSVLGAIDLGGSQIRHQQLLAAEHVERQIAVAVVVAVEEPSLLPAVHRIIGGVEIEHQLLGRLRVRVEEEVHEQRLDRRAVVGDPAVAVGFRGTVLEPVERALAGERRAAAVPRLEPAEHHPEHRVVAQPVVVDQVLVAERDAEHPLPDPRRHLVDQPAPASGVREAGREALDEPDRPVGRSEQEPARVRRDRAALEIRHHRTAIYLCESHRLRATLCWHRGDLLRGPKSLSQNHFPMFRTPMHLPLVRYAG